ncbi:MAG: alpha/beta hydrolase [Chitinophagaceae bacterium]|nr:alpha/beta hydrolase [Chitinophagaceae bacterium]
MYSDQELLKNLSGFASKYTELNGVKLHYVEGGEGEPLVLIPGWPETWWAYHKVMPLISSKYRVIVVDLRGMGSSEKPPDGYDKKNMAKDIYELIQKLNYEKIHICGHDIGAHVAFSFAANYPGATSKLIVLDTPHPDESMYQLPMLPIPGLNYPYPWWLAFNQVKELPEVLLTGRMNLVIDWVFNALLNNPSNINEFDKAVYSLAYDNPESIRSSNAWYQTFAQDIQDIKTYKKIDAPVMGIACSSNYEMLKAFLTKFATNIGMEKIEDSGHFLLAEKPQEVAKLIMAFLE